MAVSPAQAKTDATDDNVACVDSRLDSLNQSDAGKNRLATVSPLTLGDECGADHGWTSRKSTSASLYAVSGKMLKGNRGNWAATGYPADLPDRVKRRMTLAQVNELVLDGNKTKFTQMLTEELAITGSKLHADDRIDNLSLEDSNALGQKLGAVLMGLFMREEWQKFFDNPGHQSDDLYKLMNALIPDFVKIETRLK
jgi:hypothetical protein